MILLFENLPSKLQVKLFNLSKFPREFKAIWKSQRIEVPEFYDLALAEILIKNGFKVDEVATVLRKDYQRRSESASIKYFYKIFKQAKTCVTKSKRKHEAITQKQIRIMNWLIKLCNSLVEKFFFFKGFLQYGK